MKENCRDIRHRRTLILFLRQNLWKSCQMNWVFLCQSWEASVPGTDVPSWKPLSKFKSPPALSSWWLKDVRALEEKHERQTAHLQFEECVKQSAWLFHWKAFLVCLLHNQSRSWTLTRVKKSQDAAWGTILWQTFLSCFSRVVMAWKVTPILLLDSELSHEIKYVPV